MTCYFTGAGSITTSALLHSSRFSCSSATAAGDTLAVFNNQALFVNDLQIWTLRSEKSMDSNAKIIFVNELAVVGEPLPDAAIEKFALSKMSGSPGMGQGDQCTNSSVYANMAASTRQWHALKYASGQLLIVARTVPTEEKAARN